MLLAGNYRCVQEEDMRAIRDAVHLDLDLTRSVYDWVNSVCPVDRGLGGGPGPLREVRERGEGADPAPRPRRAPCSAGAPRIERADHLVQSIAAQKGMRS